MHASWQRIERCIEHNILHIKAWGDGYIGGIAKAGVVVYKILCFYNVRQRGRSVKNKTIGYAPCAHSIFAAQIQLVHACWQRVERYIEHNILHIKAGRDGYIGGIAKTGVVVYKVLCCGNIRLRMQDCG